MFRLEKEMIPILRRDLPEFFGSTHVAEEFVSGIGRPDLVLASVENEGSFWKGTPPDYQMLHLLIKYLNKEGKVVRINEVFGSEIYSQKKIQNILDTLKNSGYLEFEGTDSIIVKRKYRPVTKEFVSIEAKLSDWKNGAYQALRYKSFSTRSYLAISEEFLSKVDKAFLKTNGIGLITVSNSKASIIIRAKKSKPTSIVSHCYLSEQLINSTLSRVN